MLILTFPFLPTCTSNSLFLKAYDEESLSGFDNVDDVGSVTSSNISSYFNSNAVIDAVTDADGTVSTTGANQAAREDTPLGFDTDSDSGSDDPDTSGAAALYPKTTVTTVSPTNAESEQDRSGASIIQPPQGCYHASLALGQPKTQQKTDADLATLRREIQPSSCGVFFRVHGNLASAKELVPLEQVQAELDAFVERAAREKAKKQDAPEDTEGLSILRAKVKALQPPPEKIAGPNQDESSKESADSMKRRVDKRVKHLLAELPNTEVELTVQLVPTGPRISIGTFDPRKRRIHFNVRDAQYSKWIDLTPLWKMASPGVILCTAVPPASLFQCFAAINNPATPLSFARPHWSLRWPRYRRRCHRGLPLMLHGGEDASSTQRADRDIRRHGVGVGRGKGLTTSARTKAYVRTYEGQ